MCSGTEDDFLLGEYLKGGQGFFRREFACTDMILQARQSQKGLRDLKILGDFFMSDRVD